MWMVLLPPRGTTSLQQPYQQTNRSKGNRPNPTGSWMRSQNAREDTAKKRQ